MLKENGSENYHYTATYLKRGLLGLAVLPSSATAHQLQHPSVNIRYCSC